MTTEFKAGSFWNIAEIHGFQSQKVADGYLLTPEEESIALQIGPTLFAVMTTKLHTKVVLPYFYVKKLSDKKGEVFALSEFPGMITLLLTGFSSISFNDPEAPYFLQIINKPGGDL